MNKTHATTFIIITLVIDAMGIGLIIPVMPALLTHITGGGMGDAAMWSGILTTLFALMQFLCGPTLGALSDRFGRRPILLISLVVIAIDFVIMGLANTIWLLIVTRLVGGIATATHATASAFISDISNDQNRAANFGKLGAAFGIGFILGPVIGGLLGDFDFRVPFFAAAGLAALNFTFGYFILPETVTDKIRRPFDLKRANPIGALQQIKYLRGVNRYLLIFFLYEFAFNVYPAVWAFFAIERFGWSESMIGLSLGLFGISFAIIQAVLIGPILNWLGETRTLIIGFTFNALIFVIMGFTTSPMFALFLTPFTALGAVVFPTLQNIISRKADADQQGEIQGIISSVRALAMACSFIPVSALFYYAIREGGSFYMPGLPFLLSAFLVTSCLLIFITGLRETGGKRS